MEDSRAQGSAAWCYAPLTAAGTELEMKASTVWCTKNPKEMNHA